METAVEGKKVDSMNSASAAPPPYDQIQSPSRTNISVTHLLVGVNVAVFLLMAISGASPLEPTRSQLIRWGANWGPLSLGSQPWRILTSNYVHIGLIHILFNMWCLWGLGQLAERVFGRWLYFLVYTASGIAGSVASLWWHPSVVGAGASGAIFGLAGAVLPVLYLGKLPIDREALKPTLKSLLAFVGYNLFFGLRPGVDNSAHLGGLAGGLFLGLAMARSMTNPEQRRNAARLAFGILGALLVGITFSLHKNYQQLQAEDLDADAGPKAVAALRDKNYEQAVRSLTAFTKQDPKSPQAQYLLGTAYLGAHRPTEALAAFGAALQLKPDYADAQAGLGMAYSDLGRNQEAQEAFKKAGELKQ
jgi:membrane associated rhomboid family serine protease